MRPRGVVLLAVLVFVALLLPLITLVLTSINTESVSTAEAIKGAKAELAAEKAINDAIALVVQNKARPDYWTSVGQPTTAIIVRDTITGQRRNLIDTSATGNIGAGLDDVYGTSDDYYTGPRGDRTFIGDTDSAVSSRNYNFDFTFQQMNGPTYVGQPWSFSTDNRPFAVSPFTGSTIAFFNQFAAEDSAAPTDNNGDGLNDGYVETDANPFIDDEPTLAGPGYYPGADGGPAAPMRAGLANASNEETMLLDPDVEQALYNAKVNLYESVFTDLDQGPLPTSMLKSYANVTDEAGRLNLNMFCKKVKVYMPESADTDYDADGYPTDDYNQNTVLDELGWKWMDNPLFPDRYSTAEYDFNPTTEAFSNPGGAAATVLLDWGGFSQSGQAFDPSNKDGFAMPDIGESVQHYYEGDTDNDGLPQSVESMRTSINMLTALGLTPLQATRLLTYLNPPQDGGGPDPNSDPWEPGNPNSKTYPTLNSDLNGVATLPYGTDPLGTDPSVGYPDRRIDACNLTPPLMTIELNYSSPGVLDQYRWRYDFSDFDDMPLPLPHPLRNIDELLSIPGFTQATVDLLRDKTTIFSYDTNVIANYVADVSPTADLVNAYLPGDPQYNGSTVRAMPESMKDTDNVADLRYDVSRYVLGLNMDAYRTNAAEMYAYIREHLPRPLFDKITLPVVDRLGRADVADSMMPNDDPQYDLNDVSTLTKLVPHRDPDMHPYNVSEQGHEMDNGAEPGAGYPALNPAFSLDSCLSIVMYRNGSVFSEDDYGYNPQDGAWNQSFGRYPTGLLFGLLEQLSGPYADYIRAILGNLSIPTSDPDPNAGFNANPRIRAHGPQTMDIPNLVNVGAMDSTADLLDVPLYKFGRLSVSMMADPPSGFRWDRSNPLGSVNAEDANESAPVNYYLAFSDVVDYTWYLQNVAPDGPDGRANSGDEPDQSRVLYTVNFTYANRPIAAPDISPAAMWDAVIPLTARQLRLLSGGTPDQGSKVTIGFFNPLPPYTDPATGRQYSGGKFLIDDDYVTDPRNQTLPPAARPTGTLRPVFNWREVPLPEEDGSAGAVRADADGRPNNAGDWPAGFLASAYTLQGGVTPWAYDRRGDTYLTARCEVVNEWKNAAAPDVRHERADDSARVYLQYNERAQIPFRVSILPVRVSGSEFEIRSAFGGAQTWNGTYLLYDWNIPGFNTSYDGTWPDPQAGQTGDPRIIRVSPRDTTGAGASVNASLRLYDLRAFVDASDPDGGGGQISLPIASGTVALGPAVWTGSEVFGRSTYLPLGTGSFPLNYIAAPGTPAPEDPSETDAGYAYDDADVQSIDSGDIVRAQITALEPSVYRDDNDVPVRVSATGGQLNYAYRVRVLNPQHGDPANPGMAYPGPDLGVAGGDANSWPGPTVNYTWEDAPLAEPRHSELSLFTFPAAGTPFGPNPVASNHYSFTPGDALGTYYIASSDQADLNHSFDFTGLTESWYWVEVAVWDNNAPGVPGTDPADAYAYTKVWISTDREPGGSTGEPPTMNASIWMRPLDSSGTSTHQLGFNCGVAVDGGSGGYNYYWVVTKAEYDATGRVLDDVNIADQVGQVVGVNQQKMTSNEANPRFAFDPDPASYGTYFIHCYVMDHASSPPANAQAVVAHDVALITLNDSGATVADPGSGGLSRTPMALLSARPPGNASIAVGQNSRGVAGNDRPYLGSTMILPDKPVIDPDMAATGQTVIIRGYNFDPLPQNNTVRFAGDIETRPFSVRTVPGAEANTYDPPGAAGPFAQMELYVKVPQGARPGYVNVTTSGGTSERVFFQTGYTVSFDLIGSLSINDPTMVDIQLDYQGDGHIDFERQLVVDSGTAGLIDGASEGVSHDYAEDGVGNYDATLIVRDILSGRKQVSHQLVTIKDLRSSAGFLTVASGLATGVAGAPPAVIITDTSASFLSMGTVDASWTIYNTNSASPLYGRSTLLNQVIDNTNISIAANILQAGDSYEIRKNLANPTSNAMLNNAWPQVDLRSETFTGKAGEGVVFRSAVGGVSNSGLRYKWALNLNDVTTTTTPQQNDRIDFIATGMFPGGGAPPVYVVNTNVNWTYVNLPTLPFNVFNDSDGGAIWRVTAVPGDNVPGYGVLGSNDLRLEYVSGGGPAPYTWAAGNAGHYGSGNLSGNQVTAGNVYDIFGGANNPDYGRLDNLLLDALNNFRQAGPRGVSVGDLAFNLSDGSLGTIYNIDSDTQLRMDNGQDPTHVLGLLNGGPVGRGGQLSGRSPDLAPGAPFQNIFDITEAGYNWHGRGAGAGIGGFIVGDGNPAMFVDENGAAMPYAGDSLFWNTTDSTAWEVIGVNVPPAPNDDTMRVRFLGTIPNALGIPVGPTDGLRIINVLNSVPLGGAPPVYALTTSIDWTTLNLPALPFVIHNNADLNASWRVTALPGDNVPGIGVLANNQIRVEYVVGGTLPYNWLTGELGYIVLNAQWAIDDVWQAQFPRNQWRVNYQYRITTMNAGIGGDQPQGTVWADCSFADIDAPVDFFVSIDATYGMSIPATVELDWDGDGTPDQSVLAQMQANGTSGSTQQVKITHAFSTAELPPLGDTGVPSQALFRTLTTATGQTSSYVSAWQTLPIIVVGGDDFDRNLSVLNLSSQKKETINAVTHQVVHRWDNSKWNRVNLETSYSVSYPAMDATGTGINNTVRRWIYASDQLVVPPGMEDNSNTLTTWASYSKPFVYANSTSVTFMRHTGIHGAGSALNWVSDANADTVWNPMAGNESPLGNNPQNYFEYQFANGGNQMDVPGGLAIRGASFPRALPGVGRADVTGGFVYYQARKGVFNGFGFVADNLVQDQRAFSFDSQALFWGDRVNNPSTSTREQRGDFYINSLIGGNTQVFQFTSAVSSATETSSPTYNWTVVRRTTGGIPTFTWNSNGPNPVFDPVQAARNALGAADNGVGWYDVYLSIGANLTAKRTFDVRLLPLQALLMANPPSGSVGDDIEFPIYVEGGTPPYTTVDIDYGDGTSVSTSMDQGNEMTFAHAYDEAGDYTVVLTVTDSTGTTSTDTEIVNVAESIPLNVSLALTPASGVAPFGIEVWYAVSGGSPVSADSGNGYNVSVRLVSTENGTISTVDRLQANTFGTNGRLDDLRLQLTDDDPVFMMVPAPGNYYVEVVATDDSGRIARDQDDVFASGYLVVNQYGDATPQVVRDMENRPMHAVRVWRDPFLSRGENDDTEDYRNTPATNTLAGGRLMEGDMQVLGDILTTDPNPSFRSFGMNAVKDPLLQPMYYADYSLATGGEQTTQDFYDTFTEGRININTASEDVLTALFRKCIKQRSYSFNPSIDLGGASVQVRVARNPAGDAYVSEGEARAMARAVVKYRAAYYDMYKPTPTSAGSEFGYTQSNNSGGAGLGGSFRVDHLPAIGPWDGVNPHEYAYNDRDAQLQEADEQINNAWDNMAASYYDFSNAGNNYMFYAPTDIACVRSPWDASITVTDETSGQSFSFDYREPLGNYAKYLNDTVTNRFWYSNRGTFAADWYGTGLYQGTGSYSRWAFDARNYFTYSPGRFNAAVNVTSTGAPTITFTPVAGTQEDVIAARNRIGIIKSNDETAYSYVANPPFRNLFDLFNVIDAAQDPRTFEIDDTGAGTYSMVIYNGAGGGSLDNSTIPNLSNRSMLADAQVFSGPSVFRYAAHWDNQNCEFITLQNYLDDIAPYVTCRSYTFRIEAAGAVDPSGGASTAETGNSKTSRQRGLTAVIDVGPLWSHRTLDDFQTSNYFTEPGAADIGPSYTVLWRRNDNE